MLVPGQAGWPDLMVDESISSKGEMALYLLALNAATYLNVEQIKRLRDHLTDLLDEYEASVRDNFFPNEWDEW